MQTERDTTRLLRSFLDISLQLTQDLDIDKVLIAIVERSMELTGAQYGAAVTLFSDGGIEHFLHRGLTPEQVAELPHLPEGRGLLGLVLQSRSIVRLTSLSDHPSSVGFPDRHVPMEAFLGAPIQHGGRLVGSLYLTKPPGAQPFTDENEELIKAMSSIAAVAIQNSRLFRAEQQRAERAALLREVASQVRSSPDPNSVLATTVEALGVAAAVDRCFIRLVTEQGARELGRIEHEWCSPEISSIKGDPTVQYPISTLAAATASTSWSDDVVGDKQLIEIPDQTDALLVSGARAVLSTPLMWAGELLGVVTFHSVLPRRWSAWEIELIEGAATEVSLALNYARRLDEAVGTAARLRELDQLRSDFVAMVSHELRTPMTVIAGISDILRKARDRLSEEKTNDLIETLGREARRLSALVSQVLDLEAIEEGKIALQRESVDLGELAEEATHDAGLSSRCRLEVSEEDLTAQIDRDKIKQVFLNLLANAAKFSGSESEIVVGVKPEGTAIVGSVQDRGPGINPDDAARLFQRFSRLPSAVGQSPGSGLGLFVSRTLIERHGGRIWMESVPGEGATFYFWLPRST